ncbi:MAG TPA: hypothetical protein VMU53_07960 [Candidatus Sulfotelmatobacter sp.]|nr:hypothetical protein [Candidatus Sulfotelmatobacter sp.]
MNTEHLESWGADWLWGVPLILVTVMIQVHALSFLKRQADQRMSYIYKHHTLSVGSVTLSITILHAFEAVLWAGTFLFLGAVPDPRTAMLYSLNALTAFGHTDVNLEKQWQLMGALESLNGWILFGLSTAYIFGLIQRIWAQPLRESQAAVDAVTKALTISGSVTDRAD